MSITPLSDTINAIYPVTGTMLPLDTNIDLERSMSGIPLHYNGVVADTISGSGINDMYFTSTITETKDIISSEYLPVYKIPSSSMYGKNETDPGLDLFKIRQGYPGAVYQHIGLHRSGNTWIQDNGNPLIYSATGSLVTEQRKSFIYAKKLFSYAPLDKAVRHYPFDQFDGSRMLDKSTNYQHSTAYTRNIHDGTTDYPLEVSGARFDTVTHNHFTGDMLIFHCWQPMSDSSRGSSRISVPRMGHGDHTVHNNTTPWSVAFLINPASGSAGHTAYLIGENQTSPGAGFSANGTPFLRADNAQDFWYPRLYTSDTFEAYTPASSVTQPDSIQLGNVVNAENPYGWGREELMHVAITYESYISGSTDATVGKATWYINGKYLGEQRKVVDAHLNSGSFFFDEIGAGYQSGNYTSGYSGSLGQFRFYHHALSLDEVRNLNKHPHLRGNRDHMSSPTKGREIMTRRLRSNGYAPFTDLGQWSTSHSLAPADYRDDPGDASYYEGSKLTAAAINAPSPDTIDNEEVIKITIRNRYNLVVRKDLPQGANLDIK